MVIAITVSEHQTIDWIVYIEVAVSVDTGGRFQNYSWRWITGEYIARPKKIGGIVEQWSSEIWNVDGELMLRRAHCQKTLVRRRSHEERRGKIKVKSPNLGTVQEDPTVNILCEF